MGAKVHAVGRGRIVLGGSITIIGASNASLSGVRARLRWRPLTHRPSRRTQVVRKLQYGLCGSRSIIVPSLEVPFSFVSDSSRSAEDKNWVHDAAVHPSLCKNVDSRCDTMYHGLVYSSRENYKECNTCEFL